MRTPGCQGWHTRLALEALAKAVALSGELQDVTAMRQAIQQSAGQAGIAKDLGLFGEGQIGGDDQRAAQVATTGDRILFFSTDIERRIIRDKKEEMQCLWDAEFGPSMQMDK
jgi:hypothetical protein